MNVFKKITQKVKLDSICSYSSDKDDDFLFELAYVGKADAIISGDKHVLNCEGEFPFKLVSFSKFTQSYLKY